MKNNNQLETGIYTINCNKCHKKYIGETRNLNKKYINTKKGIFYETIYSLNVLVVYRNKSDYNFDLKIQL